MWSFLRWPVPQRRRHEMRIPRKLAHDLRVASRTDIVGNVSSARRRLRKQPRGRNREAVLATGLSYAADTWSRLAPTIDAYAGEWTEHSESVCLAHHDGRMSDGLFDRANACFAQRRASLDALLAILDTALDDAELGSLLRVASEDGKIAFEPRGEALGKRVAKLALRLL